MPIREYQARDPAQACDSCRSRFEKIERLNDEPLQSCPSCGAPLARLISAPSVGSSQSGLDDRAKNVGFHKLKKTGKGEYEKLY